MDNPFERLEQRLINIENLLQSFQQEGPAIVPAKEIIDGKALITRLGITNATLIKWRGKKKIPFMRIGKAYRYDWNQVCDALSSNKAKRSLNG